MPLTPLKLLFMVLADSYNTNAQSLNAREIALRLDPALFASTLFYDRDPDERLVNRRGVRLVKLPPKRKTSAILGEMYGGHKLITYMDYSPAALMFLHSPRAMRRGARTVLHVEAPAGQLADATGLLRFLHKSISQRCDVHVGITEFVARDMLQYGLRAQYILPVGVDTSRFVPPAAREGPVSTVLFAGTVIERKGAHLLVYIARAVPAARFLIVGAARGGFDDVIRKCMLDLGVTNVEILGALSQALMIEVMQRSNIFLLPSHLEGIPKVTLEAAAAGLPCVVFKSYETPSVVDGLTGFQVENLEAMISRVRLLAHDADLCRRMGTAAVQHAQKFDWDVIAPMWQEAYLRIAEST